jgi:hypothetical protein
MLQSAPDAPASAGQGIQSQSVWPTQSAFPPCPSKLKASTKEGSDRSYGPKIVSFFSLIATFQERGVFLATPQAAVAEPGSPVRACGPDVDRVFSSHILTKPFAGPCQLYASLALVTSAPISRACDSCAHPTEVAFALGLEEQAGPRGSWKRAQRERQLTADTWGLDLSIGRIGVRLPGQV